KGHMTLGHPPAFAPFGEPYEVFGQPSVYSSFTGDTQDTFIVSGSNPQPYDTPNRELHPVQARWLSPDPAGMAAVDPSSPQSWNRYGYFTNNPLSYIDPPGLFLLVGSPCGPDGCGGDNPFYCLFTSFCTHWAMPAPL